MTSPHAPPKSPSPSDVLRSLDVFGPEQVPVWSELDKVNNVCERCLLIDWFPVQTYLDIADGYSFYPKIPLYQPHRKVGDLRTSAHRGCHLCTLILTCLLTTRYRASIGVDPLGSGIENIDDDCTISVDCQAMASEPPVYLNVTLEDPDRGVSGWLDLGLPIFKTEDELDIVRETDSDGSFGQRATRAEPISFASPAGEIAKYWLNDCTEVHRSNSRTPLLPKRVIDVSSKPEPFLCETYAIEGNYATLSYCWGKSPVLTTTKSTFETRKESIPLLELPQTLRDAIWWTRQLGLQYIWIDSLCIIQDSAPDLERELRQMAAIYGNSTITIAATASRDVSQGCFPLQNKLSLAPCNPTAGVVIQPDYSRHKWIYQKGALEDRAWTFQEVQLSPRVIRCGGEELAWQCRHCKRREGDPIDQTGHNSQDTRTFFGTRPLDDVKRLQDLGTAFNLWYHMVSQFVTRNLSYPEDRLPAFSGMANRFASVFQNLLAGPLSEDYPRVQQIPAAPWYFAGLWDLDLLHGLCWRTLYPGKRIRYRAPSWSWPAFESQIVYNMHAVQPNEFLAEVLDVYTVVPGLNHYGKVSSGKLTLFGPVAPVPSQVYSDDSEVGSWKWKWPLVTWDHDDDEPPLGCVCLRLQTSCCLILAPVSRQYMDGLYQRAGMVITPTELEDPEGIKMKVLNGLDWQPKLVTII